MRAAIYCRLSKEDQDAGAAGRESESIQNQRSMLTRYAREQGYEIAGVYVDEDRSGIDRTRPAFNRMLEAASRREFEIILAKTQSRFTRDMELVEKYLHGCFAEWGIRFIAVVDHVDTADPANKKSRQINGLVNEWYLEDLSENVRSVLTHKRRQGRYIAASALYGYRKDPLEAGHLIIDPEAAGVVRQIFALCLAGSGITRIARLLNEQGVPSPARYKRMAGEAEGGPGNEGGGGPDAAGGPAPGGSPAPAPGSGLGAGPDALPDGAPGAAGGLWSRSTVHQMLKNRSYMGDLEQGRHRRLSYKSPKTVWLPREDWIIVPGTHEPIIPPETFWQVQRMMAGRTRGGGAGQVDPLAGLVVCGLCGGRMEQTGAGGTARRYWRCRMPLRAPGRCPGQPYLPADALAQLVSQRIRSHAEALGCPAPAQDAPLPRSLAAALIEQIVISPLEEEGRVRPIEIVWRF